jgi:Family of unknown function (DUF5947)
MTALASPRLRRLARGATPTRETAPGPAEQCELCGEPVPREHRHLLDLDSRELLCACRACTLLFDRPAAANGHLRLVPDRRQRLAAFTLPDALWERLSIPVDIAFFFRDSRAGRVVAYYPSPMGPTESHLELTAWQEIEDANPSLARMQTDVEALLVNRARGRRGQWLVPIDDPYRLVAVIRTRWRGFTGGSEVWREIDAFFEELDAKGAPR